MLGSNQRVFTLRKWRLTNLANAAFFFVLGRRFELLNARMKILWLNQLVQPSILWGFFKYLCSKPNWANERHLSLRIGFEPMTTSCQLVSPIAVRLINCWKRKICTSEATEVALGLPPSRFVYTTPITRDVSPLVSSKEYLIFIVSFLRCKDIKNIWDNQIF